MRNDNMFLTKSKSKTEVYVLLPDKPEKFMISAKQGKDRTEMENGSVKDVVEENGLKREVEHENNNSILSRELSDMLWIKPTEKCNATLKKREILDLMSLGKKYKTLKSSSYQHENADYEYHENSSDQSLTSLEEICKSPTRLSPKERKSVRFEDELYGNSSTLDDSVFSESKKHTEIENKKGSDKSVHGTFAQRIRKSDVYSKQLGKSERQGLLTRALWQNPFNIRQETNCTMGNNFVCHQCNKTFKYQSNLRSHVKTIHSATLLRERSPTNLRSIDDLFMCEECSLVFKYSVNLRAHRASHQRSKLNATI